MQSGQLNIESSETNNTNQHQIARAKEDFSPRAEIAESAGNCFLLLGLRRRVVDGANDRRQENVVEAR